MNSTRGQQNRSQLFLNKKSWQKNIPRCGINLLKGGKATLRNLYFSRRGQQASFGMSFSMLFSIFLIVVFIGAAFTVVQVFLGFGESVNLGKFYTNLQDEVNSAWRSSETARTWNLDLPDGVTSICFSNLSAPITNRGVQYDYIQNNMFLDVNTFLIPPGEAGDLDIKKIDHLDIARITQNSNPRCFDAGGDLVIRKGVRDRLVYLE